MSNVNSSKNTRKAVVSCTAEAATARRELDRVKELTESEMSSIVGGHLDIWEGQSKFRRVRRTAPLRQVQSFES